jgi:dipeptidyl-peptidase-4
MSLINRDVYRIGLDGKEVRLSQGNNHESNFSPNFQFLLQFFKCTFQPTKYTLNEAKSR